MRIRWSLVFVAPTGAWSRRPSPTLTRRALVFSTGRFGGSSLKYWRARASAPVRLTSPPGVDTAPSIDR